MRIERAGKNVHGEDWNFSLSFAWWLFPKSFLAARKLEQGLNRLSAKQLHEGLKDDPRVTMTVEGM